MKKLLLILILSSSLYSKQLHKERYYQEYFCKDGIIEYGLPDRTRVDCFTKDYAIEVDFAYKWAEAIGQCLYYASMTNKNPGIVIIIEKEKDKRHLYKILEIANRLEIKIWTIDSNLTIEHINYPHYYLKLFSED